MALVVSQDIERREREDCESLFSEIVDRWQPSLRRLCRGYEIDVEKREELFQEVLLHLWRSLPSFRGDSSLRTWMYRVSHNVATRHVLQAVRRKTKETKVLAEWVHAGAGDVKNDEDRHSDEEKIRRLNKLINRLKPLDRQIILLYLEELPQGEIAQITGLSTSNISTRIHRIKTSSAKQIYQTDGRKK